MDESAICVLGGLLRKTTQIRKTKISKNISNVDKSAIVRYRVGMEKVPALLTTREAAEQSGIAYSLLRSAVKNGRIRTVVISKRPLIPQGVLEDLITEVMNANESVRSTVRPQ